MEKELRSRVLNGVHDGAWTSTARSLQRIPGVDEPILEACATKFYDVSNMPWIIETLSNQENLATSPDALNTMGMAFFRQSDVKDRQDEDASVDIQKAEGFFSASVNVGDFKQARTLSNWGELCLKTQQYEKAEKLLTRAKETYPRQAQPWVNLLELYTAVGKETHKRAILKEMSEKWPEYAEDPDFLERLENDPTIEI